MSRAEPEEPSGSPVILSEILARFPAGSATVLCERRVAEDKRRKIGGAQRVERIEPLRWIWPFKRGARVRASLRHAAAFELATRAVLLAKQVDAEVIFTIFYDETWILASWLASRLSGLPVVHYIHDPWEERARKSGGARAATARLFEPAVLRQSSVLVLTEGLRRLYEAKYGLHSDVIRHPAVGTPNPLRPRSGTPRRVGFVGTVYDHNRANLRALGEAVKANPDWSLQLFTNESAKGLAELGLAGPQFESAFERDARQLQRRLAGCDLLYLPLAFEASGDMSVESLRDVLPTKAVDYLFSGGETLVHCPADFELARFFLEQRAGHCISDPSVGALSAFLRDFGAGDVPALNGADVAHAAALFEPESNFALLAEVLRKAAHRESRGARGD